MEKMTYNQGMIRNLPFVMLFVGFLLGHQTSQAEQPVAVPSLAKAVVSEDVFGLCSLKDC